MRALLCPRPWARHAALVLTSTLDTDAWSLYVIHSHSPSRSASSIASATQGHRHSHQVSNHSKHGTFFALRRNLTNSKTRRVHAIAKAPTRTLPLQTCRREKEGLSCCVECGDRAGNVLRASKATFGRSSELHPVSTLARLDLIKSRRAGKSRYIRLRSRHGDCRSVTPNSKSPMNWKKK